MSYFPQLQKDFNTAMQGAQQSPAVTRILSATLRPAHYQEMLRQIYFQVRENPQIQACATAYFRGHQRTQVGSFLKHATQEVGHDQLALNDLAAMHIDTTDLPARNPLPATAAVTAFAYYQIQHLNPVGYLGYLFFLEFMPTGHGAVYVQAFKHAGVPDGAFSFIQEHVTVDVAHNRLMERYVRELVVTDADYQCVRYAMQTTAKLYSRMIEDAFAEADLHLESGPGSCEPTRLAPLVV